MDSIRAIPRVALRCALVAALAAGLAGTARAQSHFAEPMFKDGMENSADGPFDDAEAARFLAQATFGPTDADIAHLRAVGYNNWFNEQFAAPTSSMMTYYNWVTGAGPGQLHEQAGSNTTLREAWFLGALGGPDPQPGIAIHTDQLRQRMAFALSEIFVVSDQNATLGLNPNSLMSFYEILINNAFGSYRTMLEQVTLHPAMGTYLSMISNPRADLTKNVHPDENYAREINQLFSVGLVKLNADGTPMLSGGQPIPTYTQATITAFAHVFTGWTFYDCTPSDADEFLACDNYVEGIPWQTPMAAFAPFHDNGTDAKNDLAIKQLLAYPGAQNGGVVPNNGTPQQDLTFALDNIFKHPNVGPFISKQLIQRFVTSNPTPQYVGRISAVFDNDGTGVRGNLKAVIRAILLDAEARGGHYARPTTYGKLREPLLRLTHFWRAMGARHVCGTDYPVGNLTEHYANQPYRYAGYFSWGVDDAIYGDGVAQAPVSAPSVFNFFKPSYVPSGEMSAAGLLGPEFQMDTDSINVKSTQSAVNKAWNFDITDPCSGVYREGQVMINRAQDLALAGNANGGPTDRATKLVDTYNLRFMSGQMSPYMRQVLLDDLDLISSTDSADWRQRRISRALLLIMTSPEYMIQK